jgi:uncharacterized protein YcbX
MRVIELWRFPVKSLQGEQLDQAAIVSAGLVGDRRFAIYDPESGFGLTARREPRLLTASARLVDDELEITLPDGTMVANDSDALSSWLGRKVELVDARTRDEGFSYECPVDADTEQDWYAYEGASAAFHDGGIWRVSMISTATLGEWDRRRFRANVVLDGSGEDELVGRDVTLGDAVVHVETRIPRCVTVTRPQPGGIERDLDVLKTINKERESCAAIGGTVKTPGTVRVGDDLRV